MMWLVSQLWPAAVLSLVLGFVCTWMTVVQRSTAGAGPRPDAAGAARARSRDAGLGRVEPGGHAPGGSSPARSVGHSFSAHSGDEIEDAVTERSRRRQAERDGEPMGLDGRDGEGERTQPAVRRGSTRVGDGRRDEPAAWDEQGFAHGNDGDDDDDRVCYRADDEVAVGARRRDERDEESDMADEFENDPYEEAPVHQFDEDGEVDFDEGFDPQQDEFDDPDEPSGRGQADAAARRDEEELDEREGFVEDDIDGVDDADDLDDPDGRRRLSDDELPVASSPRGSATPAGAARVPEPDEARPDETHPDESQPYSTSGTRSVGHAFAPRFDDDSPAPRR